MTPILLLEINEIPWRLLDRYVDRPEFGNLNCFFRRSDHYTTLAVDTGELSPWVTWPTFHRGMNNEQHGIKNLGQDPSTFKGKPIWQEIRERGGSIGICGSMQSWPPVAPGEGGFYVPDTFAHDERCYPPYLNPLQAFNLAQVGKNARVVSDSMPRASDVVGVASTSLKSGVRLRTGARILAQLSARASRQIIVGEAPDLPDHSLLGCVSKAFQCAPATTLEYVLHEPCCWRDASLLEGRVSGRLPRTTWQYRRVAQMANAVCGKSIERHAPGCLGLGQLESRTCSGVCLQHGASCSASQQSRRRGIGN